jgi:hypothetical protein
MTDAASEFDDSGQVTRAEMAELLEHEPDVQARLALDVGGDKATALRLELTAGDSSADPRPQVWDYGCLLLVAVRTTGIDASSWISTGLGEVPGSDGEAVRFRLPDEFPETGTWDRLPACANQDQPPLEVPYRRFAFSDSRVTRLPTARRSWWVGPGAPSFPRAELAMHAFFHHDDSLSVPRPSDLLTVRLCNQGPHIARLRFTPGEVVAVLGDVPHGRRTNPLHVEFVAGGHRTTTQVWNDPWEAVLPPAPDAAGEWWVILWEGNRWLDYRRSSATWQPSPGVELEPPAISPAEELEALMAFGECVTTEFKRQLPASRDDGRKVCRTVAAFANGHGGAVLFGVDSDEATIVGVIEDLADARDRLTNIVTGNLTAIPEIEVREFVTEQGRVLGLFVDRGDETPYGVDKLNPRYYIRANATTLPATAEQVRRLARSRPPQFAAHVL